MDCRLDNKKTITYSIPSVTRHNARLELGVWKQWKCFTLHCYAYLLFV